MVAWSIGKRPMGEYRVDARPIDRDFKKHGMDVGKRHAQDDL